MDEGTYAPAQKRGFLALAFHPLDAQVAGRLGLVPQSEDVADAQGAAVLAHLRRFHDTEGLTDIYRFAEWYVAGLKEWAEIHGPIDPLDPSFFANFFSASYIMLNPAEETT